MAKPTKKEAPAKAKLPASAQKKIIEVVSKGGNKPPEEVAKKVVDIVKSEAKGLGAKALGAKANAKTPALGAKAATKAEVNKALGAQIKAAVKAKTAPKPVVQIAEAKSAPPPARRVTDPHPAPTPVVAKSVEVKPALKPTTKTASLPARPTGASVKFDRLRAAVKQSVRNEMHQLPTDHSTTVPETPSQVPQVSTATHLDPATVRKTQTAVKKTTTAPGKISFQDLCQARQSATPAASPLFDVTKHLKK